MAEENKITGAFVKATLYVAGAIAAGYVFYKLWFLRAPSRKIPNDDNLFVSPANGKIIGIRKFNEASFVEAKNEPLNERYHYFYGRDIFRQIIPYPVQAIF